VIDRRIALWFLSATVALAVAVPAADAARVRFHYVPDASGTVQLQTALTGTPGAAGYRPGGGRAYPAEPPKANRLLAATHPYTHRELKVPLYLPPGTPEVEHTWTRLVYNFGIYAVEVLFLSDGSVDVIYDSGFLRPL
jgi:hypothetical protein